MNLGVDDVVTLRRKGSFVNFPPFLIPRLPFFLRRPVADGFLPEAELAELGAETVHLRAVRMILGEEAFFEEQELVLGTGGVVDDRNKEALEVDLDAGEQLGERGFLEVPVIVEGELARVEVDFDEVGFARVAVEPSDSASKNASSPRTTPPSSRSPQPCQPMSSRKTSNSR